jgi:hypothetical protein
VAQLRWMLFVDGENFAIRAKEFAKSRGATFAPGQWYEPDVFLWLPQQRARIAPFPTHGIPLELNGVRAYYYTSVMGDEEKRTAIREACGSWGSIRKYSGSRRG